MPDIPAQQTLRQRWVVLSRSRCVYACDTALSKHEVSPVHERTFPVTGNGEQLHDAVVADNVKQAALLIQNGADVNKRDKASVPV